MTHQLPKAIETDLKQLLDELAQLGIHPTDSRYSPESFGNYYVEFASPRGWLRLVRDRGQYYVDAESQQELQRFDLWRAFDDRSAFQSKVLAWLRGARR